MSKPNKNFLIWHESWLSGYNEFDELKNAPPRRCSIQLINQYSAQTEIVSRGSEDADCVKGSLYPLCSLLDLWQSSLVSVLHGKGISCRGERIIIDLSKQRAVISLDELKQFEEVPQI